MRPGAVGRREWRSWWQDWGLKLTIGLTTVVALLSVLTVIMKTTQTAVTGPLAPFLPVWVEQSVGFTGALTGFLMMGSALGLRRGLRAAWYSTIVLLPVTAVQGLLQSSPLSLPLVILSIVTLPNVIAHRHRFDRRLELSQSQIAATAAIVGAQVYGPAAPSRSGSSSGTSTRWWTRLITSSSLPVRSATGTRSPRLKQGNCSGCGC